MVSMRQTDEIRAMFAGREFGQPCSEEEIQRAEAILGEPLPAALRTLYLHFDGFRGPTDAVFFWPLFGRSGLVEMNRFFRGDPIFPVALTSRCLFFGDNGCGAQWGLLTDRRDTIVQWDASWGGEFEIVGSSPVEAWRLEKRLYEEADAGNE